MEGGTGNDTYYVDTASDYYVSDQVIERSGEGTDHVYSSVSTSVWLPGNVENLTL